ncbi:YehR family lipoprotein [Enterococcus casseliflavus]|uniref:YehR family lipoprotein n=1 Tax=Enterococcus casseliflavus TaxID=37734 RepID=UPI0029549218|nr:YehR family protein [Enterococcus casseliflavus]MDV7751551.1 YehR family protein [Enterococcus casseliflavus]
MASCSSGAKEETKTFTMDQNGVSMELVFTYEGDKVKTQTANNVMPYSAIGVTTKEEAQTVLDPIAEQYQQVKGLDYSLDYTDSEATESLTINYDELDYDSAKQLPGVSFEGNTENGISMERTEEMLLDQGYKLKE